LGLRENERFFRITLATFGDKKTRKNTKRGYEKTHPFFFLDKFALLGEGQKKVLKTQKKQKILKKKKV
jgi:hypothetical protein